MDGKIVAQCVDYTGLIRALRQRFADLEIPMSSENTARIAGLPERYIARLLSPQTSTQKSRQTACLGMHSLGAVLGVLGLKIALVHDEEAWDQVKDRLEKRKGSFVRRGVISRDISRVYFQRIGRKGGLARWAGIDGPKRKAIMSRAHIERWRAHKIAMAKRFDV